MYRFLLSPESIRSLALVLLNVAITVYLVRARSRRGATGWLAVFTAGMAAFYTARLVMASVFPIGLRSPLDYGLGALEAMAVPVALGALLQFAFRFLGNPFPRESRAAMYVAALAVCGMAALVISDIVQHRNSGSWRVAYTFTWLAFSLWSMIVLLRKRRRSGSEGRAFGTFAGLCGLFAVLLVVILITGSLLPESMWPFTLLGVYAYFFGLVAAYVNHAPTPTPFQVRILGITTTLVLAVFGMTAIVLYPPSDLARNAGFDPAGESALAFSPDALGGYAVEQAVGGFATDRGETIDFGDSTEVIVDLGFPFPFMGRTADSVTVGSAAIVVLEPDRNPPPGGYDPYGALDAPVIAPLFVPSIPVFARQREDGVDVAFMRRDSARVVFTWEMMPVIPDEAPLVAQLILERDGRFVIGYTRSASGESLPADAPFGVRGFWDSPGDVDRGVEWSGLPGSSIGPGRGVIHDIGLSMMRAGHIPSRRLLMLMLASLAFVFLVYPPVFRAGVVRPLERLLDGMRSVSDGDLDVQVAVGMKDEIGTVTEYFNETTNALRSADAQLKSHAETLERRVDERTAALNASLDNLRATQEQLVQQEKMASLGQLTAGIAHEIKNPLNFINNFSDLNTELTEELEEAVANGEDVAELIASLKQNAQLVAEHGRRADSIVRSMMEHARHGSSAKEPVDVNAFVEEYLNLAYHGRRAATPDFNVELVRNYDADVGTAPLVRQDMGRVLVNLIGNAFDAVAANAASLHAQDEDAGAVDFKPTVAVRTSRSAVANGGSSVVIEVADNGPGIPEDIRSKIFEPFFTTKPTGQGTGLGLSLSYDVVTGGHGGSMTVDPSPIGGARFTIILPTA